MVRLCVRLVINKLWESYADMWLACTTIYSGAEELLTSHIFSPKDFICRKKSPLLLWQESQRTTGLKSYPKASSGLDSEPIIRYRELCSRVKHPAGLTAVQISPHPSGAQTAGIRPSCHSLSLTSLTGKRKPFADFGEGSPEGRRYSTDSDSKSGIHMKPKQEESVKWNKFVPASFWGKLTVCVCCCREFFSEALETKTEEFSNTVVPLLFRQVCTVCLHNWFIAQLSFSYGFPLNRNSFLHDLEPIYCPW